MLIGRPRTQDLLLVAIVGQQTPAIRGGDTETQWATVIWMSFPYSQVARRLCLAEKSWT